MRPVFIVGTARSGTSILYRTIVLHSTFFPGEVCLEESRIFKESNRILPRLQKREGNPLYEYMLQNDRVFQKFVDSVYKTAVIQRIPDAIIRKYWPYSLNMWSTLGGRKVVREFFRHAKVARGGERIVEKTPPHLECMEYMLDEFPECRILYTVRHPIDVYTSYIRRRKVDSESWHYKNLNQFISTYRHDMEQIRKHKNSKKTYPVYYDSFTKQPKQEFKGICDFIDVEFEADPLNANVPSLADWEPDPYLSKPINPNTKDYKEYISENDALEVQRKLKDTMEKWNIDRKD